MKFSPLMRLRQKKKIKKKVIGGGGGGSSSSQTGISIRSGEGKPLD